MRGVEGMAHTKRERNLHDVWPAMMDMPLKCGRARERWLGSSIVLWFAQVLRTPMVDFGCSANGIKIPPVQQVGKGSKEIA